MWISISLAACIPLAYISGYISGWTKTLKEKTEEARKQNNARKIQ